MTSPAQKGRGARIQERLDAIGITKSEFAEHANIDRGTLNRAIADEPSVTDRTFGRVEQALSALEDEVGMAESGDLVTSTIEFRGARITMHGTPSQVAAAIREVLGD